MRAGDGELDGDPTADVITGTALACGRPRKTHHAVSRCHEKECDAYGDDAVPTGVDTDALTTCAGGSHAGAVMPTPSSQVG